MPKVRAGQILKTGLEAFDEPETLFEDKHRDKNNILMMRGRAPVYSKITKSCQLNFDGRVNKSSKKNIQIEYKSRVDNKLRVVLQHGARA